MKKHNLWWFSTVLIFITISSFGQVTNTISEVKINNNVVTQINFGANATITATVKVNLKTLNGAADNILGNVFIYSKKTATDTEIQQSFSSVTFVVSYPPFVPQTTYDSEVYLTVTLNASAFNATGGVLYAEYKNNSGQKYKSSNINIVKTTPTTPIPGAMPYFRIKSIKYANTGYNVENAQVLIPVGQSNVSLTMSYAWQSAVESLCGDKITYVREKYSDPLVSILNEGTVMQFPSSPCLVTLDTIKGNINTFNIAASQVSDNQFVNMYYTPKNSPHGNRGVNIVRLIFRSIDFTDTNIFALMSGREDNASVSSLNGKLVKANLGATIGQDYITINASIEDVNIYEWYKRPLNGTWTLTTIPSYELLKTITVTTEFFRRVIYKGVYEDSNILTFEPYPPGIPNLPVIQLDNTICCDQIVPALTPVSTLIGNIPNTQNYTYKWQSSSIVQWLSSPEENSWIDIAGENSVLKDFTPPPFTSSRGSGLGKYFRRAVITPSGVSYSNYVTIKVGSGGARVSNIEADDDISSDIQLYPNPTSDILNIDSTDDLSVYTISVYDSYGAKKNISQPVYNGNKINLDTTALPEGLYLLVFENGEQMITKQFIKK